MATLGTLVTIVTADTSGFQSGMGAAAKSTEEFQKKTEGGLRGVEERLKSFKGSLRGFNEIFGLAFGFTIGRGVFEQLHEGLTRGVEGFLEAQRAGAGLWDSIGEGIQKLAGFKTATEEAAEAGAKFAKVEKAIADAAEKSRKFLSGDKGQFPLFAGSEAIDEALRGALSEAREAAKPFHEKVTAAEILREQVRQAGTIGGVGLAQGWVDEAKSKGAKFFKAEEGAEAALRAFQQEMEPKESHAELEKAEDEAADQLHARIQADLKYTEAREKLSEELGKQLQEEMEMRDAIQQNRLKDKFNLENVPGAAAAGAGRVGLVGLTQLHDQLQTATGSIPAKQLKEAEKTNVNLDKLNGKIDGLDTDLKNKAGILWA